jgi:ABC-type bacteriocin/lantibiotic exporter with double-glycine peptidase domain
MAESTSSAHHGNPHTGPAPRQRLFALLQAEKPDVILIVFFSVLTGLLYLATPLAVDSVVQNIAFGGQQQVYVQTLLIFSFALLIFLALSSLISAAQHFVAELIQQRIFVRLAADMAYRLPRIRREALETANTPELVNRFLDVTTVQKSCATILLDAVNVVLSAGIGLLVLAFYHPFLLAFNFVLVSFLAMIVFLLGRRGVDSSIEESYAKHALAGWFEQIVMFPTMFKGPGGPAYSLHRADSLVNHYLTSRKAHYSVLIRQIIALLLLEAFAAAALLAVGGILVLSGQLTLGQLVASELIVGTVVYSMVSLGKHLEIWYDAMAAVDKLGKLVELPVERADGEPVKSSGKPFDVEFRSVTFRYENAPRPLFQDIDFGTSPGERVAVTGPIGAGAGTLLEMAYGLRDANDGVIIVDAMDIRHWQLVEFRSRAVLMNEVAIFSGSILENVRLHRQEITLDEVCSALDRVGLLARFLELPDGLHTQLLAGGRPLSDSQKVKVCLARAIVGKPKLLMIDKVLDGLDPERSSRVYQTLFGPERDWTLLLATRDRNLLERCDRVYRLPEPPGVPPDAEGAKG